MSAPESPGLARHVAVLPNEVLDALAPQPGQTIVDATLGAAGHAQSLRERLGPTGRLIGLDRDATMLQMARGRLEAAPGCPFTLVHASFDRLPEVLQELHVQKVDAVLADLGLCSDQLDDAERGFSFQQNGPLDMRMDRSEGEPASALVQRLPERELADLIYQFGEERFSRRIARRIVEERQREPFTTTGQLAQVVRRCVPRARGRHPIDPATRTFQALRIAVNDELGALDRLLAELPDCIKPGGRAVLISFHSLEDRRVKQAFRDKATWQTLTKKPVQAGPEEAATNPRARSAKLRAARRVDGDGSKEE
jgi:16S rRNA (cytosine1402-N4)-methyltransferase